MKYSYFIFILLTVLGCSSVKEIKAGGSYGYEYSHRCPAYSFSKNGKLNDPLSFMETNSLSLAEPDAAVAIEKANNYIIQRGGTGYFKSVTFNSIDITYPERRADFYKRGDGYDMDKCGDIKYVLNYSFSTGHNVTYFFSVAMNDKFEILSPPLFPNIKQNAGFDAVLKPKKAYRIAMKKHRDLIANAEEMTLSYNDSLNTFVWEIRGQREDIPPKTESQERIDYDMGMVYINAASGEILSAEKIRTYYKRNPRYF